MTAPTCKLCGGSRFRSSGAIWCEGCDLTTPATLAARIAVTTSTPRERGCTCDRFVPNKGKGAA